MSIWTSLEPASTTVDPGGETTVRLRLRNTGDVVDEYRLLPVGDIAPYVTVDPPSVRLYPGTTETVRLTFAPPRTPDATAGPNPFGVHVVPTEQPEATTVVEGNLTITPFTEVRTELVPHTVKGRFRGRPKLAVDNLGNTKLTASISGSDQSDELSYEIAPANVQIEPGRAAFVDTTLKPRQITWAGQKQQRPYTLALRRSGGEPVSTEGVYVQRSVLPPWLMTVLGLTVALLVTGVILWFSYKPAVNTRATSGSENAAATKLPEEKDSPEPEKTEKDEEKEPEEEKQKPKPPPQNGGGGGGGDEKKGDGLPGPDRVLIRNVTNETCVDIPNPEGQKDAPVIHTQCDGQQAPDKQLWNLDVKHKNGGPRNSPLFVIRNVKTNLCLDLPDKGPAGIAAPVTQYDCRGGTDDNQLWWLEKRGQTSYWIRNFASNHQCLDSQTRDNQDRKLLIYPCKKESVNNHEWWIAQKK
ncbi:hydrogenase expression protein [Streptomyces sp. AJS327]|uniref:RICIN domain-containing protein n=1 Tax=Streptomyces sp. AJS327 TaxID=2545265 RepID=UPI0015DE8725|nr:RICIN domain-containing protein [Streptomyces sp. AJS327]MBA0051091.1 hydrogenase expression protein [Streptomyces sp. AJS327]